VAGNGDGRRIFLVDDDADLRDALSDIFTLFGAGCVALPSVAAMVDAADTVLSCDVAILDVNLGDGQPSGVEAYEWLRERRFGGRIVFLTGHARSHPAVARAASLGVRVLAKPVETSELRALLDGQR
jgi:DNA-binding response OmpR family regulator